MTGDESEIQEQNIKIPLELSSELKQIYVTGAVGGYTPHDFRLLIFNEISKSNTEDEIALTRNISHELIFSHIAIKELYDWLGKHIEQFEKNVEKLEPQEE